MKNLLMFIVFLFLSNSCKSQELLSNNHKIENDVSVQNDSYSFELKLLSEKQIIKLFRVSDSLKIDMSVKPNFDNIFNSFLYRNGNKKISMIISKTGNSDYIIKQLSFIHLDGRKTSVNKFSDDMFKIDLNNYVINMIECENCLEQITFLIYDDNWFNKDSN